MYKPLFFTAIMSLVACFAQAPDKAGAASPRAHAAKPCPGGTMWDKDRGECVRAPLDT